MELLQNDAEWYRTMEEAALVQMPRQLRQLFTVILTYCEPSDPLNLWETFKDAMCEDYRRHMPQDQAEQKALGYIHGVLQQFGMTLSHFNLPELDEMPAEDVDDVNVHIEMAEQVRPLLNEEQLAVADAVIFAVANVQNGVQQNAKLFYVDGPAGTGKTFTYNYIISEAKGRGWKIATAAFTGQCKQNRMLIKWIVLFQISCLL